MLTALARFTRPHTVAATTIQVVALYLIVSGGQAAGPAGFGAVLLTLITCLALNVYVVGLNQITDIDIDRINKPTLPLASREMSVRQGWTAVALTGFIALIGGLIAGPYLLATVILIMVIGSIYSLPPLRLKQYSIWAAISIAFARGIIANVGVALHYNNIFGGLTDFPTTTIAVLALFFFAFGLVIAIYKDIPDLVGDQLHGIQSFTVSLGPQKAFDLGRLILTIAYLGVMAVAVAQFPQLNYIILLITQAVALGLFWWMGRRVDLWQKSSVARFYMFLWILFYSQYVVLSLVQIAGRIT